MKLLTSITTHNRLEYTKKTIDSYFKTAGDSELVLVDNAGEEKLPIEYVAHTIWNKQNLFPGAATNIGWQAGLKYFDAELLHRSDNDIEYLPGWKEEVEKCFKAIPRLGQLGILNCHEDYGEENIPFEIYEENGQQIYLTNPGGNSVIRREIWDEGIRWEPGVWRPGGNDEDSQMSNAVRQLGYLVGRVVPTIANNISFHRFDDYPDYYKTTAALRGLNAETSV